MKKGEPMLHIKEEYGGRGGLGEKGNSRRDSSEFNGQKVVSEEI